LARFVDAIDLPLPPALAFELLADMSRVEEWDPGVVEAFRLEPGPVRSGSRFRVVSQFLGRRIPLTYELVAYEPEHRLVFRASERPLTSHDEITLTPRAGGTRVTYDARLQQSGIARLAEPLLQLAFLAIGRAASDGLRKYGERVARERAREAEAERARQLARDAAQKRERAAARVAG
jgi:uncharacterized protein YndB with AHSA1/START domain